MKPIGSQQDTTKVPPTTALALTHARVLWGRNIYAPSTVIARTFYWPHELNWRAGQMGATFIDAARACLGQLRQRHRHGSGHISTPEQQPLWHLRLPELLLALIGALERFAGVEMGLDPQTFFASTRFTRTSSARELLWRCYVPTISIATSDVALVTLRQLLDAPGSAPDAFKHNVNRLQETWRPWRLGYDDALLMLAAQKRGLPCEKLANSRCMRLGQGQNQKLIQFTTTPKTPSPSVSLTGSKHATNRLLREADLPCPQQKVVHTEQDALAATERLGPPVTVKPLRGNLGRGVTTNLKDTDNIREAFQQARRIAPRVLVETFLRGDDHRLLVVGGRLVGAVKRVPPTVVGDGRRTIRKLIRRLNADPKRDGLRSYPIKLNASVELTLKRQGYTLDCIPEAGQRVALRSAANFSAGGSNIGVLEHIHPDNRTMAEAAAQTVGLDIAGIDFITPDISRPYWEVGGGIVEVNTHPGLRVHHFTREGPPQDAAGAVMDWLCAQSGPDPLRIPVAAVVGASQRDAVGQLLADLLRLTHAQTVGVANEATARINGSSLPAETATPAEAALRPPSIRAILQHQAVDVAIQSASVDALLQQGIGHDGFSALGLFNLHAACETLDQRQTRRLLQLIRSAARGSMVLELDAPLASRLTEGLPPENLVLLAPNASATALRPHLNRGGRAVALRGQRDEGKELVLFTKHVVVPIELSKLPGFGEGEPASAHQVLLSAVGLALALGTDAVAIKKALRVLAERRADATAAHKQNGAGPSAATVHQRSDNGPNAPPRRGLAARHQAPHPALLWSAAELAETTGGQWLANPEGFPGVTGITRRVEGVGPGSLIILNAYRKGRRGTFAHRLADAFGRGAGAVLTNRRPPGPPPERPVLLVENTAAALTSLALRARDRFAGKIVCVTGSAGKTSTKNAIGHLLAQQAETTTSPGSLNYKDGLAIALARTPAHHAYGVYEFAIGEPGDPPKNSRLTRPHVGVVTHVADAHLDGWGNSEGICDGKSQMFDWLHPGGTAVLYDGMMHFERMLGNVRAKAVANILVYGESDASDIRLLELNSDARGSRARISMLGAELELAIEQPGKHLVLNAMGALAAIYALGANWQRAARELHTVPWPAKRAQTIHIKLRNGEVTLICDHYNANTASMRAAFELLGLIEPSRDGRRVAVLADMRELGEYAEQLHAELATPLAACKPDIVFTLGEHMHALHKRLPNAIVKRHATAATDIADALLADVRPGDVILFKGSHSTARPFDDIIHRLRALGRAPNASQSSP